MTKKVATQWRHQVSDAKYPDVLKLIDDGCAAAQRSMDHHKKHMAELKKKFLDFHRDWTHAAPPDGREIPHPIASDRRSAVLIFVGGVFVVLFEEGISAILGAHALEPKHLLGATIGVVVAIVLTFLATGGLGTFFARKPPRHTERVLRTMFHWLVPINLGLLVLVVLAIRGVDPAYILAYATAFSVASSLLAFTLPLFGAVLFVHAHLLNTSHRDTKEHEKHEHHHEVAELLLADLQKERLRWDKPEMRRAAA